MLELEKTKAFEKDMLRDIKSGNFSDAIFEELFCVVDKLQHNQTLDEKYKDHRLKGKMKHFRECHIKPDWLLVYKVNLDSNILYLARLGSHNQIFNR